MSQYAAASIYEHLEVLARGKLTNSFAKSLKNNASDVYGLAYSCMIKKYILTCFVKVVQFRGRPC